MRRTDQLRTEHPKLLVTIAVVVLLSLATLVAPVAAQNPDGPPPREYGESGVDAGVVRVRAGSEWLPAGSANASGGGGSRCGTSSVTVVVEDDFAQPVNQEWRSFGSDGAVPFAAERSICSPAADRDAQLLPDRTVVRGDGDGVIRLVPKVDRRDHRRPGSGSGQPARPTGARPRHRPGRPPLHPAPLMACHRTVYWEADRRAPASAGRVQVVARAEPYQVIWNPGDGTGELAPCGQGTVWQPGLDDAANECPYTYRRSSAGVAGNAFGLTATVSFEVTVTTNAPGSYGPFPDLDRTAALDVLVGEIQAVND